MEDRVNEVVNFINEYKDTHKNAAEGAKYDPNSNVAVKSLPTLAAESVKKLNIDVQRKVAYDYITKYFDEDLAKQYLEDIKNHLIYVNDESTGAGGFPYCCAISLYPFLTEGTRGMGDNIDAPKHTDSFIGGLVNLIFFIASNFAGAVAIPEFIPYMSHFLEIDFGDDYIEHLNTPIVIYKNKKKTLKERIEDWFQQFVYSINASAGSRNMQSPFTNIAYYDEGYFKSIFKDFVYPDGSEPIYKNVKVLQKLFMKWFNKEREKSLLTFPVETVNMLVKDGKYVDSDMANFVAEEWAEGHSFFLYQSDSADALSSCCRLRNSIEENVFSYTLGAGGIQTGSKRVITINTNRIVQDWYKQRNKISLAEYIKPIINRVHKYLKTYNYKLWDDLHNGLLPVYKAGFIDLDKQYCTLGVLGFEHAATFLSQQNDEDNPYLGLKFNHYNEAYKKFAFDYLTTIKDLNLQIKDKHFKVNTEQIPGESSGVKMYKWDKEDGYWVNPKQNTFNSYFFPVEDDDIDPVEKLYLHGHGFTDCLDGGSACHINLKEHLSEKQYRLLMDIAIKAGCNYFTFNVPETVCNDCHHISKQFFEVCPKCGSKNIDYASRIIGYISKVSNWSKERQEEFKKRYFYNK